MAVQEIVLPNPDINPWEGRTWPEILAAYRDGQRRLSLGEEVVMSPDCPVDDLIPPLLESLSPDEREDWQRAEQLWEESREGEGNQVMLRVLKQAGFCEVCDIREQLGWTD